MMVNMTDIFGDDELILVVDGMGYELELDYHDEGVIYLKCDELEKLIE